ncbi:transglycosylase domain-containing protein [Devriesea agamarum]|uniref:transglycosylase domain-containing protein n=1 Tax=Devriesea agamarum TaxID=472569 RepID=UPI00071D2163|nr:transglycosylase domain-containing protein [Devriesea agamarum]
MADPDPTRQSSRSGAVARLRSATTKQTLMLLLGLLAVCTLSGILLASLLLPAVTVTSAAADQGVKMFNELPDELDVQPLNEASRIEAADGSLLAMFYTENRIMLPLDQISPNIQHAIVAIEDRRFYEHGGVDPKGLLRALVSNQLHKNTQGASTLTQQYVKNTLLMDAVQRGDKEGVAEATEQTYLRKAREAKLAMSLESRLTNKHHGDVRAAKNEILNGYLNVAQFGPSQYGVETASRHYFSKNAKDLTVGEAALLAGITNAPNAYDPVSHPKAATKRRNEVLAEMKAQGYINQQQFDEAKNTPVESMLKIQNFTPGCAEAKGSGFFCDYVTRVLLNDPAFGKTFKDRQRLLYGGGLTIKTTLDPSKQKIAEDILERRVPSTSSNGFGHTIVTVEPGTGNIVVMAENRTFNPHEQVKPGETALNYNVPRVFGGSNGFPVGSTFKAFVLTEWLMTGHSVYDTVATRRQPISTYPAKCLPRGRWMDTQPYDPDNAVSVPLPPMQTALDATKYSVNTSYAQMAHQMDLCDIASRARSLGAIPASVSPDSPKTTEMPVNELFKGLIGPSSVVLGEIPIAPLEMAAAYATFPADGKYCKPRAILEVKDRNGKDLPFTGEQCKQEVPKPVADAVQYTLEQDLQDPRATGKGHTIPGHDAGGKTGTASMQYHGWYVGFTKQLSTAVWFGHPARNVRPGGFSVDGEYLRTGHVWGATVSLPTWQEFMIKASEGMENIPFPGPHRQGLW